MLTRMYLYSTSTKLSIDVWLYLDRPGSLLHIRKPQRNGNQCKILDEIPIIQEVVTSSWNFTYYGTQKTFLDTCPYEWCQMSELQVMSSPHIYCHIYHTLNYWTLTHTKLWCWRFKAIVSDTGELECISINVSKSAVFSLQTLENNLISH